jgi:60 kDa SS-A/Ro ribonucleoprotein
MSKALRGLNASIAQTPVTEKAKPEQVVNNTGGFVFKLDDEQRFRRFLILGVDKGTFYAGQQKHAVQNVDFARKYITENADVALATAVDVSVNALAKSNSQAIFTVALAMNLDGVDRKKVAAAMLKIVRTSTHLFEYAAYLKQLGGWGRAKKNSIANWYQSKSTDSLAYQVVKFRQRDGWTHRDLFRLAHPKDIDTSVGDFVLGKDHARVDDLRIIEGFKLAQKATSIKQITQLITDVNLPWEAVPTSFHKDLELWKTLFYSDNLGQTALLRNVVRISKLKGFDDMKFAADYADRLSDPKRIVDGKIHPIQYLNAAVVYEEGQIERNGNRLGSYSSYGVYRNKDWITNPKVLKALEDGFIAAFKNVEPANKRTLIGTDISGSMSWSAGIGTDLTAAQVSAAIGMTIARTEPYSMMRGFSHDFIDLGINENDSFATAMRKVSNKNFGSTNVALPMEWATKNGVEVDTFVVITDNETNSGRHPYKALQEYRRKTGIDAKLAVFGVTATDFTVADASDRGMMDFVGFDASALKALADFSAGRI